ncbi:carboxylesterase family protein [Novosphingobium pokkalii]|uniref:carboxylesterase family protein n=1 Tax=Novosphingobium pokkalii TaxID=1770194 RepID=UPI00363D623D
MGGHGRVARENARRRGARAHGRRRAGVYRHPLWHGRALCRPAPARPWTGEWDATRPARAAPQPPGMDPLSAIQAEDCLQLNVWAPAAHHAARAIRCWYSSTAAATKPAGADGR